MNAKILFVDDDTKVLNGVKRRLHRIYDIYVARSGQEGLRILDHEGPFAVAVADQRMPGMDGLAFLKALMERAPLTARIMLTGNADRKTAIDAVNEGRVFRFLNKPCRMENLSQALDDGIQSYNLLTREKQLLEQTLAGSVKLLIDILAISNPDLFQRISVLRNAAKRFGKQLNAVPEWELDMAVMLSSIGDVMLPPEVRTKLRNGEPLEKVEQELVTSAPEVARDLLLNIPRMRPIAEAIYYKDKGFDGSGFPYDAVKGTDIPLTARILQVLQHVLAPADGSAPNPEVFAKLEKSANLLDPELVEAARECFSRQKPDAEKGRGRVCEVSVSGLLPGDKILDDLKTETGKLALSENHTLTQALIQRIRQFNKLQNLKTPIRVERQYLGNSEGQSAA